MASRPIRSVLGATLRVAVVLALVVLGLPHVHEASQATRPAHTCRLCKVQEAFAAKPSRPDQTILQAAPLTGRLLVRRVVPHRARVSPPSVPRAPPVFA